MIFGIGYPLSISFVLNSLMGLIKFCAWHAVWKTVYTLIITILRFRVCISWYSTYELDYTISCFASTALVA